MLEPLKEHLTFLDYGSGGGHFYNAMVQAGYNIQCYDPFDVKGGEKPQGHFDVITAFEVFEHLVHPKETVASLVDALNPGGMVLFTTTLNRQKTPQEMMNWWYLAPRNGHCSLYTAESLVYLWDSVGFKCLNQSQTTHFAFNPQQPSSFIQVQQGSQGEPRLRFAPLR
ncbi:class I SAM-dependent methyltransferase [Magnetococcus sp. PR-3]|uniref:class I SAM-dependent methyltransferase n=1 Tax=Magnetococcus sp. PR-3 TaxID=3120355 RepID=UPI002FCE2DA7